MSESDNHIMDKFEVGENGVDWEELVPKTNIPSTMEDDDDLSVPSLVSDEEDRVEENYSSYDDIEVSEDGDGPEEMLSDSDVNSHVLRQGGDETSQKESYRQVWCHGCNENTIADFTLDGELCCRVCKSDFVEEVDQGVEEFLGGSADRNTTPSPPVDRNQVVNQVLSRIFNIANLSQPSLQSRIPITVVREDEHGIRRPVGVLFRQLGPDMEPSSRLNPFSALETRPQTSSPPSGLLDLLLSLSSIRQGSPNFNNEDALSNSQFEQFLHHVLMNENAHSGAPAATEEMIDSLPSNTLLTNIEAAALGECSISQEVFEVGDVVLTLPCEHKFKQEPIVHWLKLHRTCPVCRIDIVKPQVGES